MIFFLPSILANDYIIIDLIDSLLSDIYMIFKSWSEQLCFFIFTYVHICAHKSGLAVSKGVSILWPNCPPGTLYQFTFSESV